MTRHADGPVVLIQIVDPHRLVRSGLRMLLENQPGVAVRTDVASIDTALPPCEPGEVLVLNIDAECPSRVAAWRTAHPQIPIVALTCDAESGAHRAAAIAAAAVVHPGRAEQDLIPAIDAVRRGELRRSMLPGRCGSRPGGITPAPANVSPLRGRNKSSPG